MKLRSLIIAISLFGFWSSTSAQNDVQQFLNQPGSVTGNVQVLFQQYNEDTLIGAQVPPEKAAMNAFGNIIYSKGKFSAGMRFESYLPSVLGYPDRFDGSGIGYRFADYTDDKFKITIGNFYEQFGTGLTLRTYEERNLGVDNALDGVRVVFRPVKGMTIKGVYGLQRLDFQSGLVNGPGIVRGVDGEVSINDLFKRLEDKKTKVTVGGMFVSKFQSGGVVQKDSLDMQLPENVANYGGRINIMRSGWNFMGEYVYKINDPNADNQYIYKPGRGIFANLSYSKKGFGFNSQWKTVDNMSYRSDRDQKLFDAPINYIPAITKQHTYILASTLYPYGTVINGEASAFVEFFYKFQKGTLLGGKYGTGIAVNYALANNIDTSGYKNDVERSVLGYQLNSFGFGKEKFVRDFNVEIKKKLSKKVKMAYTFMYMEFNTDVAQVTTEFHGIVYANIHVIETNWKIKPKHSLRTEIQGLFTQEDRGSWAALVAEYTFSPHWFLNMIYQYNYGNPVEENRIHYPFASAGYINGPHRISLGYGKRREGVFCVGGVCRAVPASNGLEISITSTF